MAGPAHVHLESILESQERLLRTIPVQQSFLRHLGRLCAPLQHDSLSSSPVSSHITSSLFPSMPVPKELWV